MKIPFKNYILSWILRKRIRKIRKLMYDPINVQKKLLLELLYKAKDTKYGKENKFDRIQCYKEYSMNVEIKKYEDFYPYIQKIKEGGKNILWPGKIKCFAKSSGTTDSESKYIPITMESLKKGHIEAGKDMLSIYCYNNPKTKIFSGKGLMLGGSQINNNGCIEGDLSAILLDNFPFWVNMHRTPDIETALLARWEEKLDRIVDQAIKENVTNLTGATSWMLIVLNMVLEKTKAKDILEVWPNLELYMHGGMSFLPYKNQFQKLIPNPNMNYMECYNASEGFFAIQDQASADEMLLMLDYGIFYEFIDMKNFNNKDQKACSLAEVKLNINYAMVITTNTGLWRYLIGDTIKFTSLSPFKIKVVGRTKGFINTFGEELVIENAEIAIMKACNHTNAVITEFTAAPVYIQGSNSGSHEWLVEFKKRPNNLNVFTKALDNCLQNINSDYKAKRENNLILKLPIVKELKDGTFYTWLKQKDKLGGQNKVPRLNNNRIIVEEILLITKTY